MFNKVDKNLVRKDRHKRIRSKINGTAEMPRLCVYRSLSKIYAQIIDDSKGVTLVSASSLDKEIQPLLAGKSKSEQAKIIGEELGKRAKKAKIKEVVFDRGGYVYTGRVAALAEGARSAGLKF